MKRFSFAAMAFCLCIGANLHAEDFNTVTLAGHSGTNWSFSAPSLRIVPEGDKLRILSADGKETNIDLTEISGLTLMLTNSADVNNISADSSAIKIYSIQGAYFGSFNSIREAQTSLPKGIYIVKNNQSTRKLAIR